VALTLAVTQLLVCGATITVAQAGAGWVLLAGVFGIFAAAVFIWQFESSPLFRPEPVAETAPMPAGDTGDEAALRTLALQ
jgi:hypothetical protein